MNTNVALSSVSAAAVINSGSTPGEHMSALALELAAIASPSMDDAIAVAVKAKDDWDNGPVTIMMAAINDYDAETLARFPDPDVKTGNNPSVYMVPSYKDGKRGKDKEEHFYTKYADGKPKALAIRQQQEWLTRAGNDKMKQDGIPADILALNPDQRDQMRTKLDKAMANFRSAVKNGFKLMFKIKAVNGLIGCSCYVVPGAIEGTFENLIHVNTTVAGRETVDYDNLPISTFNRLNVQKAQENGGTFAALMATKKRAKPGEETAPESGAKPSLIRTIDTVKARVTDIWEYVDFIQSQKDNADLAALLKTLGPKGGEGTDQFAHELYSFYQFLSAQVYKHDALRARGQALVEADATGTQKTGT